MVFATGPEGSTTAQRPLRDLRIARLDAVLCIGAGLGLLDTLAEFSSLILAEFAGFSVCPGGFLVDQVLAGRPIRGSSPVVSSVPSSSVVVVFGVLVDRVLVGIRLDPRGIVALFVATVDVRPVR